MYLDVIVVYQSIRNFSNLPGALPEKLAGAVQPAFQDPTLFMTKICDIPYPIYDLTKNSNPTYDLTITSSSYFRPAL